MITHLTITKKLKTYFLKQNKSSPIKAWMRDYFMLIPLIIKVLHKHRSLSSKKN